MLQRLGGRRLLMLGCTLVLASGCPSEESGTSGGTGAAGTGFAGAAAGMGVGGMAAGTVAAGAAAAGMGAAGMGAAGMAPVAGTAATGTAGAAAAGVGAAGTAAAGTAAAGMAAAGTAAAGTAAAGMGAAGTAPMPVPLPNPMPDATCYQMGMADGAPPGCLDCLCTPNDLGGCLDEITNCEMGTDAMSNELCTAVINCARAAFCTGASCLIPCMAEIAAASMYTQPDGTTTALTWASNTGMCTAAACPYSCGI